LVQIFKFINEECFKSSSIKFRCTKVLFGVIKSYIETIFKHLRTSLSAAAAAATTTLHFRQETHGVQFDKKTSLIRNLQVRVFFRARSMLVSSAAHSFETNATHPNF